MSFRSSGKVLIKGTIGVLIFLILVGVVNVVSDNVDSEGFLQVVEFINQNLLFIILISVIMLFGELFATFMFPFNIPYPLFNALGGAFWVEFIFRLLRFIDTMIEEEFVSAFEPFYPLAMIAVILIVLVVGFIHVFHRPRPRPREIPPVREIEGKEVEWKDVGKEVKGAAYNLASMARRGTEPKKKAKEKVKKKVVKKTVKKKVKKK